MHRALLLASFLLLSLLLASFAFIMNDFYLSLGYSILLWITLAVSWAIFSGYTGYLNFGFSAFFGVGAQTVAIIANNYGIHPLLILPIAGLIAAIMALALGVLTLRLRGPYFTITSLASAYIFMSYFSIEPALGSRGISLRKEILVHPFFPSRISLTYFVILLITIVAILTSYKVRNSKLGIALDAIRDDELAAEIFGVNALKYKLITLFLSGFLCGLTGGVNVLYQVYIEPAYTFSINYSFSPLVYAIIGGATYWYGPIIGATIMRFFYHYLSFTISSEAGLIIFGIILIIVNILAPGGIAGLIEKEIVKKCHYDGVRYASR